MTGRCDIDQNPQSRLGPAPPLPCAKPLLNLEITFGEVPADQRLKSMNFLTQNIAYFKNVPLRCRICHYISAYSQRMADNNPEVSWNFR